jgi:hypothetical protein
MPIKPENYKLIRRHFIKIFNKECAICKVKCLEDGTYIEEHNALRTESMQFDHIHPNGYHRHDSGTSERIWEWFEAYEHNNLQMLCKFCNQSKKDN